MKHSYIAPTSVRIELMHRESLMVAASAGSLVGQDDVEFEANSKGWSSNDWSGEDAED